MKRKKYVKKRRPSSKRTARSTADQPRCTKSFASELQLFFQQVDSLSRATDMTIKTVSEATKKSTSYLDTFMKAKGVRTVEKDVSETYRIKPEDFVSFTRRLKDLMSCVQAQRNVPRIFLCSLVHHYDAYLGRLLRVVFFVKPELLNSSQRQLSFTELVALSSMDAAREYVIEKEVETVIRDSHAAQFDWMETRFGLTLRKDLPAWPRFIEITERRNLFVHCDGVVSSQYLATCRKHGVDLPKGIKAGDELDVTPEYFSQAVECILEVGVKLGHVLWRKLQPDQLREADKALHWTSYNVLAEERYSLVKILLHFAVDTLKEQSSEEYRRMNLINLAIAHNFSGERQRALDILKGCDWSASADKFKLAVAILEHRHADAVRIMNAIGAHGSVTRVEYSSWPLFKDFRHTPDFLAAYRELFGEDFVLPKHDTDDALKDNTRKVPTKPSRKKPTKPSRVPRKARGRASRGR